MSTTVFALRLLAGLVLVYVVMWAGWELWGWVTDRFWDLYYWVRYGTTRRL